MRTQPQALCTQSTNKNVIVIEFSRRRTFELSTLSNFIRVIAFAYKRARQSKQRVVRIQSALCEENSCGLKIAFAKIYRKVVSAYDHKVSNRQI